jgi:membrane protein
VLAHGIPLRQNGPGTPACGNDLEGKNAPGKIHFWTKGNMANILRDPLDPEHQPGADWRTGAEKTSAGAQPDLALRASEPGRGRNAARPSEIPWLGWRDIFVRVLKSIPEDRVLATSGSVAFFAMLAVFPAAACLVSLYGLFADARTINLHLVLLSGFLPASGIDLLGDQMVRIAAQSNNTLGVAFFIALAVALWSANSGVIALFDALNVVYKEREKRNLVRLYGTALLFTAAAMVFTPVATAVFVILPYLMSYVGLETWNAPLISVIRWPFLYVTAIATLSFIYRYGPSRKLAKWRWISGSMSAAAIWLGMSMLFSWYVAQFDSYNRVYGSLGAVVGFMTWIWVSVVIILVGAELNAEMELQTAVDSTSGEPRRLGRRGAIVADSIGEAQD